MDEEQRESLLNQRAENQRVREAAWGFKTPEHATDEGDDMRETVLGDKTTTHTHYHSETQKKSGLGKLALLAAAIGVPLTAGAIMAPAIIEALNDDPAPTTIVQPAESGEDLNTQYELQFFED